MSGYLLGQPFIGRCRRCHRPLRVVMTEANEADLQMYRMTDEATCCGSAVRLKPIHGTHRADVPCTASCRAAVGPDCECSCAGENHGADWTVRAS